MFGKSSLSEFRNRIFFLVVSIILLGSGLGNATDVQEIFGKYGVSYTQSMGYLKAFLGDNFVEINTEYPLETMKINIREFYNTDKGYRGRYLEDHLEIRTDINHSNTIPIGEALLEEYNFPDRDFAYHGASPQIGLLYDIYSEVRRQVMNIKREDLFVGRGTDQVFIGLQNVADFINEQLGKQNKKSFRDLCNYGADYAEKALSINLFLFGNCGTAFDDTIKFFIGGESYRNIFLKRSLIKLFTYFGIDLSKMEEIEGLIAEFEALPLDRGRLFQFSFAPGTIDEFVYLSKSLGAGVTIDGSEDYNIEKKQVSTLIHNIRKIPLEVKQLSETVHHIDEEGFSVKHFDFVTIQGRFLPHPKLFCEDSPLKVRSYWRGLSSNAPEVLEYRQTLKDLISRVVTLILESRLVLPKATLLSCNPLNTLFFSKPCSDVIQEKTDMLHMANPIISDHLLSAYICSGDLEQFSQALEFTNQADINRFIIDINDLEDQNNHSPLYLAVKYNHPHIVDFLLSKGARVENEVADNRNLMGWACMNGYPGIIHNLLDSGCDPNSTFRVRLLKDPVVTIALEYGFYTIVEKLLNHQDYVLSKKRYDNLLKSLLKTQQSNLLGAFLRKVNFETNNFKSPNRTKLLNQTIKTGNEELVKIVLEFTKAPLEYRFATPAIIKAIDQEKLSIIQLLINVGADLTKQYSFYGTPLERAHKTNNQEVISLIQSELGRGC
jgi:hypothetical protein